MMLTGTLVVGLAGSGKLGLGSLGPLFGVFRGPPASSSC